MITLVIATLLQTAAAVAAPRPAAAAAADIVVTGRRLKDTRDALARCIAAKCPPREDIAATLAHAENLFVAGRYQDARGVLLAARGRDARYARRYPVEVAGLLRANARVASLVGEPELARIGMVDTLDALRAGLPAADPRVLMQKLEVGDAYLRLRREAAAAQAYDAVAREARRAGLPHVEGQALFRTAVLYAGLASVRPEYREAATHAADRIDRLTDPAMAPFRQGILLLRARLDDQAGRHDALDRAIAELRRHPVTQPILLSAPAIVSDTRREVASNPGAAHDPGTYEGGLVDSRMRGDDAAQWIDVGFWITPDGSVRDAEVLRHSDNFAGAWSKPVLKALALRRYAPLALDPGDPGLLRVERYSRVSDLAPRLGSHIPTRSGEASIEMLDLTAPQAAEPPGRPPVAGRG